MALKLQLLFLVFWGTVSFFSSTSSTFYKALYSDSLDTIESALKALDKEKSTATVKAYQGGLIMKKSDFLKTAAKKVEVFKAGHQLLESAIKESPQNVEYRFIRLTIQEHAPKLLKYNKNIEEDKKSIIKGYSKLSSKTRAYILAYAQQSTILKAADFK